MSAPDAAYLVTGAGIWHVVRGMDEAALLHQVDPRRRVQALVRRVDMAGALREVREERDAMAADLGAALAVIESLRAEVAALRTRGE